MRRFFARARAFVRRSRFASELDDEIAAHLETATAEHVRRGKTAEEARLAAVREFGGVARAREQHADVRGFPLLDAIANDLRYAWRGMRRTPGFTLVAVAMLALGIGASTAVFSVINAVVLRPLPAPDADRIVRSESLDNGTPLGISDPWTLSVWRNHPELFEDVSEHRLEFVNLTGTNTPEQLAAARVSQFFFRLFGVPLFLGRSFTSVEDTAGGPASAILSYELWTRRFGRDPRVLGRTIVLGNVPHTIVGVTGPAVDTEQFDAHPDVWLALQTDAEHVDGGSIFQVSARLRPGVTLDTVNAQLRIAYRADAARERRAAVDSNRRFWAAVPVQQAMVEYVRPSLNLLLASVAFLLILACANVAHLSLLRAQSRQREIAIRGAIGASRTRILRQLLIESLTLSLTGGTIGVMMGPVVIRALLRLYPTGNPFILGQVSGGTIPRIGSGASAVTIDGSVLAFAVGLSVVTAVVFGMAPAWQASAADVRTTLQRSNAIQSAGRRATLRNLLVVAEIAIALTLLTGGGLLVRSAVAIRSTPLGLNPQQVLTMRMSVSDTRFATREGITVLARQGAGAVEALPGVQRASLTCCMPLETVWQLPFVMESRAGEGLRTSGAMRFHAFAGWTFVAPGYFSVFRIPMLRGRDFSEHDDAAAPGVVIINDAMARRYWPGRDPLKDSLIIGRGMRAAYDDEPVRRIIGIVGDVRDTGVQLPARPAMYVPAAQEPGGVTAVDVKLLPLVWIVRTSGDPHLVARGVQQALEKASGGLPVARMRTMDEVLSESTARGRFDTSAVGAFAACALVIAVIGIYGLIAFWIHQRSREIGLRLALGANPVRIVASVIRHGALLAIGGIVIGGAVSLGLARLMAGLVFGVSPQDPVVFTVVPALLLAVVLAAIAGPAWRASRIDPVASLRAE